MTYSDLKRLVRQGEGLKTEFKRKVSDPLKIIKGFAAFANTAGGQLLIGVADDGSIPGLKFPEEDQYVLEKALTAHCHPKIIYTCQTIEVEENKYVLVYDIPASPKKPIYCIYNLAAKIGKAYIRIGAASVQASNEMRKILKEQSRGTAKPFAFGESEAKTMSCFTGEVKRSLAQIAEETGLPTHKISAALVVLTVSKVLEIIPGEKEDFFKQNKSVIP